MAKFLETSGVTYHVQQIIDNTREKLVLISPYLRMNDRIKLALEDQNRLKTDVRLVYGKNELQPAELNWLRSLRNIKSSYLRNLHAKCYLNEKEAVVTSMNLYDFSQVNNFEMGIYVEKSADPVLYNDVYNEAMKLVRTSDEIEITVSQVPKTDDKELVASTNSRVNKKDEKLTVAPASNSGFCIRCGAEIKLDPKVPYCRECYKSWKKFENSDYEEKLCHVCGKPNKSTLLRPACYDCYKAKKSVLEFPLV